MIKYWIRSIAALMIISTFYGCYNTNIIKEINVGLHHNNELKIQIDVATTTNADVYVEYWQNKKGDSTKYVSTISKNKIAHTLVLCNMLPQTSYSYHIIVAKDGAKQVSKTYTFQSQKLPLWLQEQFKPNSVSANLLPSDFKNGLMLVNKRYPPGAVYLVDYKGQIRWYHTVDKVGVKVAAFTQSKTILTILGRSDEPTSYGSEILEVNLLGDTLLHLKKGQGQLPQSIHHEIIKNDKNQIVTLFVDKRNMDLTTIGGSKKDTIVGDGIIVLDRNGKKIWQWSVFDALNPLKDPNAYKSKKDWMHANSLNFDKDGNYIISFYNNGQIWKIDAKTGAVLWKLGKGGDIKTPAECDFTQAHAVHMNKYGDLMLFDNGVEKKQSSVFALKLDELNKKATIDLHVKLPTQIYNGRMGSAYMINDTSVLVCCSKRHIVALTNKKGVLQWTLETAMPTYRAVFVDSKQLIPYLKP